MDFRIWLGFTVRRAIDIQYTQFNIQLLGQEKGERLRV